MVTAEGFGIAPEGKRIEVGRLLACRAAVTDAQRNLIEATQGVRVSVSTSVSHYAAEYDVVKTAVDGVVRGASILNRDMGDDDTCKVTMGLFIAGPLSNSIYQKSVNSELSAWLIMQRFFSGFISSAHAQELPLSQSNSNSSLRPEIQKLDERVRKLESNLFMESPSLASARIESQPTGLIIDVRGYRFLPSIAPNIQNLEGETIYPSLQDKEIIMKSGKLLSLFSRSLEFAMNHPIVGDNPLLIKAQSSSENATNIILNQQNGERLGLLAANHFFAKPAVIIVLD